MTAPTIHLQLAGVTIWHGDSIEVLRGMPDNSVHAIVCDPPYGLEFMGAEWDSFKGDVGRGVKVAEQRATELTPRGAGHSTSGGVYLAAGVDSIRSAGLPFQQWCTEWAAECLRVLTPGGHMLAFGGSRTWHRLAAGIEDAGFELRDSIAWMYGSGFPKSHDVSKAIDAAAGADRRDTYADAEPVTDNDVFGKGLGVAKLASNPVTAAAAAWSGWGTALKPGFEPIVVARKPLTGTVAESVLRWGTGAMNIDGARVEGSDVLEGRARHGGGVPGSGSSYELPDSKGEQPAGRWPANVILSHVPLLDEAGQVVGDACESGCVGGCPVAELDRQAPNAGAQGQASGPTLEGPTAGTVAYGARNGLGRPAIFHDDEGGASRFFPTFRYEPKAPARERPRVWFQDCTPCGFDPDRVWTAATRCPVCGRAGRSESHPTVKPLDLMRWLVRLVTPPGGTVMDPFLGSGTTAEAAIVEGFEFVGMEREARFMPLIDARLERQPEVAGAKLTARLDAGQTQHGRDDGTLW